MTLFDAAPTEYREVLEIARGGMGAVSLVVRDHGPFDRLYAMKRLLPDLRGEPTIRAMFLDEARIAGHIRHPNVVSVIDVGEDEHGPYLMMDYVEGVSLGHLNARLRSRGRAMPMGTALEIVRQVAAGLQAAHDLEDTTGQRLGVIHRDVSPQNILLGFDGYARLTDFGIAKALGRTARTQTGILKGKLGYMAPEVLRFEDPSTRSDLFSLGVVLFESLTLRRLYPASGGPASARAILNDPPPDLGEELEDAPDALVELIFSLLAKDPAHRPESAAAVEGVLRRTISAITADVPAPPLDALLEDLFATERRERTSQVEAGRAARRPLQARRGGWIALGAAVVVAGVAATWVALPAGIESATAAREPGPVDAAPAAPAPAPSAVAPDGSAGAPGDAAMADAQPDPTAVDLGHPSDVRRTPGRARRQRSKSLAPMWDWQ